MLEKWLFENPRAASLIPSLASGIGSPRACSKDGNKIGFGIQLFGCFRDFTDVHQTYPADVGRLNGFRLTAIVA